MTECSDPEVRSYLPDLMHGRLGDVDTATLTAHVEGCRACAADLALLREVRESAPLAPPIDVAGIVALLPLPGHVVMETPAHEKPRFGRPAFLRLGMIAVLVAGVSMLFSDVGSDDAPVSQVAAAPAGDPVPAPPQEPAITAEVAPSRPAPSVRAAGREALSLVAGVQDLTDEDIEMLIADLDGIDSVPSADPDPVTLSLDELEAEG